MYLVGVVSVFGAWIIGDRTWSVAVLVVERMPAWPWPVRRVVILIVALSLSLAVTRPRPSVADVTPTHDRAIAETHGRLGEEQAFSFAALTYPIVAVRTPSDTAMTHTVVRGDCLWSIARSVIISDGDVPNGSDIGLLWRSIYSLNRSTIGDNPSLIFPGQVLVLPER